MDRREVGDGLVALLRGSLGLLVEGLGAFQLDEVGDRQDRANDQRVDEGGHHRTSFLATAKLAGHVSGWGLPGRQLRR